MHGASVTQSEGAGNARAIMAPLHRLGWIFPAHVGIQEADADVVDAALALINCETRPANARLKVGDQLTSTRSGFASVTSGPSCLSSPMHVLASLLMETFKYLAGYPPHVLAKVQALIGEGRLGAMLNEKYGQLQLDAVLAGRDSDVARVGEAPESVGRRLVIYQQHGEPRLDGALPGEHVRGLAEVERSVAGRFPAAVASLSVA